MSDKVTVKQTINKATSIYKIEHITVGKPGSEQYRHAFELADQLGLKHPDCIEHVFPTYADEQCTGILLYKYLGPTCARTDTLTPSSYCCH
ncbi:hypothetical protein Q5465_14075 [Escherichia coli]|uniref:Uncharacterized protein n=1 Tax=Escherichia coli TaxID=562 RepID=A0AAW5ZAB9_ECOLX|nr:hypothetical protein [Escherichia coli]UOL51017.1 hypothetical protein JL22_gp065 [Escherichia phage JL22]MCA7726446.1 hypothetical protein [Escherichia coli]MCI3469618.1 hypothetical protein [Escherichia coli]MCI3712418.1 hypothetical protein [Escherichia coli]MCI3805964.1 hypothetical protein [Escherichia coli]